MTDAADVFRSPLDQMIDLRHSRAVRASRSPWQVVEASIAHAFAKKARVATTIENEGLFDTVAVVVGTGGAAAGRPWVPLPLVISLLYLKDAFNESDEGGFERWSPETICARRPDHPSPWTPMCFAVCQCQHW